ncbi:SLC13 family permease [Candidatus Magnetomonas plexicatena]|uniref:SLC13 family permease n=1 Tax=Candidatus Magnetomonas plexicatena TaxID=2552947 RepID=UPI0011000049|nr:TRAP transporter large permease subunit [Nitrospirales bacterium LBB_01]
MENFFSSADFNSLNISEYQSEWICSYLLNDEIFSKVDNKELARLLPHIVVKSFKSGQTIYTQRQHAQYLYMVVTGDIKVFSDVSSMTIGSNGKIGVESCSDLTHYVTCATVLSDATVLMIPRDKIDALKVNKEIKGAFILYLLENFAGNSVAVEEDAQPSSVKAVVTKDKDKVPLSKVVGWVCVVIFSPLALWQSYVQGLDLNAIFVVGTLTATIFMWIFKLVDEFVPGIFALLAFLCIGVAPPEVVLSGFTSDGFFLAMSVLGLGTVIVISGLSYRIILWLILKLPKTQFVMNLILIFTGIVLTPIIPTANGRIALLSPFLKNIIETCKLMNGEHASSKLAFSTFTGATLLSGMFLTSKSVNFVVLGMMPAQVQEEFQWMSWLVASFVTGIIMLTLVYAAAQLTYRNQEKITVSTEQIRMQLRLLGSLSLQEWSAIAGILFFMLGILTYSLHKIQPPWIGLSILYGLLLFGCLKKKDFREKVDWPFLIYLASVVGIIQTMKAVGINSLIAKHLSMLIPYMHYNFGVFVLILTVIMFVMRIVMPINAAIVLIAAVFMPLADIAGLNSWLVGFIILVLGEMWVFPYQCSYYMQFHDMNVKDKTYDEKSFLRLNMLVNILKLAAIYVTIPYWKMRGLL